MPHDDVKSSIWRPKPIPDLDDRQFLTWRKLLEERIGMEIPEQRRSFLKTSLGIRMRELDIESYDDYYTMVTEGQEAVVEWNSLIDRLTVQETRFFRDPDACRLFVDHLRNKINHGDDDFHVWSVGCATGEEPYSLAILIRDQLDRADSNMRFSVTGTDVSNPAILKARQAHYNARKVESLPRGLIDKYLTQVAGHYQIKEVIKKRVCFTRLNVLDLKAAPIGDMDVIYCQNVMIYFRRWLRKQLVDELVERLKPGGMLILGLGELVGYQHPKLVKVPSEKALAFLRKLDE